MPTVDEAVENITWAAGDSFLSDYLNEVLNEVFERVEEDGEDPEDVLDDVVIEWLDRSYIYDKVYDYYHRLWFLRFFFSLLFRDVFFQSSIFNVVAHLKSLTSQTNIYVIHTIYKYTQSHDKNCNYQYSC